LTKNLAKAHKDQGEQCDIIFEGICTHGLVLSIWIKIRKHFDGSKKKWFNVPVLRLSAIY